MQIRCQNCHKPFGLARETIYAAIHTLREQNLSHYNAFCPHCRRANRVSLKDLQHAAPDWARQPNRPETG